MVSARQLSFLALSVGTLGARIKRSRRQAKIVIAGTPVYNYHLAYAEYANLAEIGEEDRANLEQNWLLVTEKGTTDAEIHRFCKRSNCLTEGHPDKGGVGFFEVRATEAGLAEVIESAQGAVKFVEPDSEVQMIPEIEADIEAASWGLDKVGASKASATGSGVHVYVLDTGIRATHTDFGGRVIPTLDITTNPSGTTVVVCQDADCAGDVQGHGTHCAGSAAGTTYGVAPEATLHSVKVLSDSGSGSWGWSYAALDWLAASGERPAVASMSLGGSGNQAGMKNAVDGAVDAGVTVVVAGGNDNDDACGYSPAFVPSAITVGSTTSLDARSGFSNYGSCTDIWAPGSSITSASHTSDTGSRSLSGTSMACPHVSGAAALWLQEYPSWKSPQVISALLANASLNIISDLKAGDVSALLYVGKDGPPPPPPATTPPPVPTCPSFSRGPDSDGDCRCNSGRCSTDGGSTFRCPTSGLPGGWGGYYFLPDCLACQCGF